MIALALRYWWAFVIAGLIAFIGIQSMRISHAQNQLSDYKLEVANAERIASELARKESERMQSEYNEQARIAREENESLQKDVVRLADVADGVRDDLATFRKRAGNCAKPAIGGKGKPSADPLDLLIGLYQRADREAEILARYSQELRTAGLACERSVDGISRQIVQPK